MKTQLGACQVLLRQEFDDRKRLNAKYSARAMARDLGLSPAFYSQIMSGRRGLSDETADAIAKRVGWSANKRRAFVLQAQLERTKSPGLRQTLTAEFRKLNISTRPRGGTRRLNLDAFSLVSDWYHYAIVELTELVQFQNEPGWIAKSLSLSVEQVTKAVDRLIRVGLLSPELRKQDSDYRVGDIPSEVVRKFHRQMLKFAATALEAQPPDQRDFSSCTLALDPGKLPEARVLIREFQKELMELMAAGEKSAVYHMSMQLFRLDRPFSSEAAK